MNICKCSHIDYYKILEWHTHIMKSRKQGNKETEHLIRSRIADASELPKDVIMGQPVLTLLGRLELNIENYRGIIEYTDVLIRVQTKTGQIRVTGKNLRIDYYTNDDMKITGRIDSIEYQC